MPVLEPGDRMFIPCEGGPAWMRLVDYPPPLELVARDGMYVLVDDGPVDEWRYRFLPKDHG